MSKVKKPFYKRPWFIILAVLVVFTVIGSGGSDDEPAAAEAPEEATAVEELAVAEEIDRNLLCLMDATTLTELEAETVFGIMQDVGIVEVSKCDPALGTNVDELQSFSVVADSKDVLLTIEEREVYYIGFSGVDLYDASNGGVINQITDFGLSSGEVGIYMSAAENYIEQVLVSPSSADFPGQIWNADQWSVGRYKNIVEVSSYVDSQNSFGAMLRSYFTVQMDYDTSECTYINFDGETIYGECFTPPNN